MVKNILKIFSSIFLISILLTNISLAEVVKQIEISGNKRITSETIKMFGSVEVGNSLDDKSINLLLKKLYDTTFFEDVSIIFKKNILKIKVKESPIIENVKFSGIKAKKIKNKLRENLKLKSRSSFNEYLLRTDKSKIINNLKELGYYFASVDIFLENLADNKVNINYNIDLGDKAKIKKISFIGNKIFKDRKLKNVIVSEEYKFWKFVTGRKFLSQDLINLDTRLLRNYYLNKGYYKVEINSSFAKLVNESEFELIYNINAKEKFYFGELKLEIPPDYDDKNFINLKNLFIDLKNKPYSLNRVENILEEIDKISISEQFESISASVIDEISSNKINLKFVVSETEKFTVEKINIYGNNVTRESVLRNQFEIDEGDFYNEILQNKTINNLKSLNFFKSVKSEVIDGNTINSKIINISVEEKPTGEISAGAGFGTSGATIQLGIKENNYLGKGLSVNSNVTVSEETLKGILSITNPNFNNTDKSIYVSAQALETDRLTNFGYKTNKTGFTLGTNFEYLKDFVVGLGTSSFYEKIETDSTASARQKKQEGNYWDTFLKFDFDYDKRNQRFQTSDGFRSFYNVDIPVISDRNTFINSYDYKYYTELYEDNISTFSVLLKGATSLTGDDIKLSERLYVPSKRLRGFERGKVGPKDGNDFIGGNYLTTMNFTTTLPQILENSQNVDFLLFLDAANVWGVDYDSSLSKDEIRSSVGIAVDWFTFIGPLSFSLAQDLSKSSTDITESFRFNLGTTF